jgi:hypothetical protein
VVPFGLGPTAPANAVSGIEATRRDKKRHTNN